MKETILSFKRIRMDDWIRRLWAYEYVDRFFPCFRDAPEPTGEEPEDADLDAPKIYEMVNNR